FGQPLQIAHVAGGEHHMVIFARQPAGFFDGIRQGSVESPRWLRRNEVDGSIRIGALQRQVLERTPIRRRDSLHYSLRPEIELFRTSKVSNAAALVRRLHRLPPAVEFFAASLLFIEEQRRSG